MNTQGFRHFLTISAMLAAGTLCISGAPARAAEGDASASSAASASSSTATAKGIAGKWKITMDGPNGNQIERDLTLTQTGSDYSGKLSGFRQTGGGQGNSGQGGNGQGNGRNRDQDLQDVTFKDGEVSFTTSFARQNGDTVKRTYHGKLNGDVIEGTVEGGQNTRKFRATRVSDDSVASGAPTFAGTWDVTTHTQDRDYKGVVTLQKSGDALSGEYQALMDGSDPLKAPVKDISVQGNTLKFSVDLPIKVQDHDSIHLDFSGPLDGDTIKGQETSPFGPAPFTAVRRKAESGVADPTGEWTLTVTTPNGTMNPTLIIRKEGSGYVGEAVMQNDRHLPLKEVTFDGKTLKTVAEFDRNGETTRLEMASTLDGDTLKGDWKSPRGTTTVTGKRNRPATASAPDVTGEWNLTIHTDNGDFTPTLILRKDGAGYAGETRMGDNTLPLKTVTVDGQTVKYTVEFKAPNSDDTMTIENTVKIDGDSLTGEAKSPQGTVSITGKRKVASK